MPQSIPAGLTKEHILKTLADRPLYVEAPSQEQPYGLTGAGHYKQVPSPITIAPKR